MNAFLLPPNLTRGVAVGAVGEAVGHPGDLRYWRGFPGR